MYKKHFDDNTPKRSDELSMEIMIYNLVTRVLDVLISVFGILFLLPLFFIVGLCIKIDDPNGTVIFLQQRIGKNGKEFSMFKFRSMYSDAENNINELIHLNEADGAMFKIKNDPRITRVGKIIRRTSIDELPQLINVIRGDMSLVGPRPPLPREVMNYTKYELQRLSVTPGITGLWQVSDGNTMSFSKMVELDIHFIEKRTVKNYFKILFKTVKVVLGFRNT